LAVFRGIQYRSDAVSLDHSRDASSDPQLSVKSSDWDLQPVPCNHLASRVDGPTDLFGPTDNLQSLRYDLADNGSYWGSYRYAPSVVV
jgi:hypothetical protein